MNYRILALILIMIMVLCSCAKSSKEQEARYVVLSPEVAEILYAIGAGDKIVGITEECTFPEALKGLAVVGKFGALNREQVIALKPTIIFSSALEQEAIAAEFSKLGYRVESFYPESIDDMLIGVRHLGVVTNHNEAASSLADSLSEHISAMKQSAPSSRPKIYLEIYRDPLMSVADSSFVGQLIEVAGGDNIFSSLERDYARVKTEAVIQAAPDIMICYSQDSLENILNRKGWQDIPAIRDKRIYFEKDISPDLIQRAGPRIIQGLQRLREIILQWETGR